MKTTAMRKAERRKRQRARRRAREQRAAGPFADRPQWWRDGLASTPTGEIVATLAGLNIHTDETRLREMASAHGSPDALADVWEAGSTATDIWEDYVWMAAVHYQKHGNCPHRVELGYGLLQIDGQQRIVGTIQRRISQVLRMAPRDNGRLCYGGDDYGDVQVNRRWRQLDSGSGILSRSGDFHLLGTVRIHLRHD